MICDLLQRIPKPRRHDVDGTNRSVCDVVAEFPIVSSRGAFQDRATSAAIGGAAGHQIQKRLRHKRFDTTAGYIQDAELFKDNAAASAGL